jgi:hypothetical protein
MQGMCRFSRIQPRVKGLQRPSRFQHGGGVTTRKEFRQQSTWFASLIRPQ